MTRKRTRPDPTSRAPLGPFVVSIRPTRAEAWRDLREHLADLRKGPEGEAVEALEAMEKNHGEAFYAFALEAIKGRSAPLNTRETRQTLNSLRKAFGWPRTDKEQRRRERHDLARALYLFLQFMEPRWGSTTGVLQRYMMKHGEDVGGAGAVRRCLRAAGIPVPKSDVEDFGRRYCYRETQTDATLARDRFTVRELEETGSPWPSHLCLPDLAGMEWKKRSGKVRIIIGGVNKVPADPDALALRLVTDGEEDWSLAAVLCLCLSLPAEAREAARTIPAVGNMPDHVEAWRLSLLPPELQGRKFRNIPGTGGYAPFEGILQRDGADPVTSTPAPGTPGTPGECANIPCKTRTKKRHKVKVL